MDLKKRVEIQLDVARKNIKRFNDYDLSYFYWYGIICACENLLEGESNEEKE